MRSPCAPAVGSRPDARCTHLPNGGDSSTFDVACFVMIRCVRPDSASLLVRRQLLRRQHHDGELRRSVGSPLQLLEKLEPVHDRHHQVEQNERRRRMAVEPAQAVQPVARLGDREPALLQHAPRGLAGRRVVLDDADRRRRRRR